MGRHRERWTDGYTERGGRMGREREVDGWVEREVDEWVDGERSG